MNEPTYLDHIMHHLNAEKRINHIRKRQTQTMSIINRLQKLIYQIVENVKRPTTTTDTPPKVPAFISDHTYARPYSSSGSSCSSAEQNKRFNGCSAKRKIIDDEKEYQEFSAEGEHSTQEQEEQFEKYPQEIGGNIILGPNGTQVDLKSYSSIIWSSAASATRQLLGFVFTSDVLATHTLTGKPSPAFYGRERPAKIQLDPIKVADIIHCVRSKFKCTEREIRAAITTKCSDTSKKYKRRHQKQLKYTNATH